MRIGKVIGHVTLASSDPAYRGPRWLMVNPMTRQQMSAEDAALVSKQPSLVVFDNLGAGAGDVICFVEGGEATQPFDQPTPVDAINIAIIDSMNYSPPTQAAQPISS